MNADTNRVVIVGTGFAGLGMAIRLKQAGFDDFTILDQADSIGGTWRDNHYPGAACDVPSHLYSFSFEPNAHWARSFGDQKEILAYLNHCADKYGLRPHMRLGTRVLGATFDERTGIWDVATSGGPLRARFLVVGSGPLSRPSYPEIPGLETFAGKTFHSARWDHSYSLEGKNVAVIGTGASAIQIAPAIAPRVARLDVFQRTPPWIVPKPDVAIPPRAQALFARAPSLQALARIAIYWLLEWRAYGFVVDPSFKRKAEAEASEYMASQVRDAALRARLTPNYALGCKRVLPSNDYFATVQRPNVELVTSGIERIVPHGIVTKDGRERALDAIVLATGFHAAEARAPFEIRGKDGRDLDRVWESGAEAYLGTSVAGFPNLFFLVGPNTGLGHNSLVFMIEAQVKYVIDAIRTTRARNLKFVDVRAEVQRRYNAELQAKMARTVWSTGGCKAWYTTRTGKNTTLWPGFTFDFRFRTRRFDGAAYHLVPDHPPRSSDLRAPVDSATASAE